MGSSASKRVETKLQSSVLFQTAVQSSFEECLGLSQHASAGIFAYQLLDATNSIFKSIPSQNEDPVSRLKDQWLPDPPTHSDIHRTIRQEGLLDGGKQTLSLEEFRFFAVCVFRDMILTAGEHHLGFCVPVGALGLLLAHFAAIRLPVVGPIYKSSGLIIPGILVSSGLGALAALLLNFP